MAATHLRPEIAAVLNRTSFAVRCKAFALGLVVRMEPDHPARFWAKVRRGQGCWEWIGQKSRDGYGRYWLEGRHQQAHRIAYELLIGPIPAGLEIDHRCNNRGCMNPAHMVPATHRENSLRSTAFVAVNLAKTHCPQGHPYDAANTGRTRTGGRYCRACRRERKRTRSLRNASNTEAAK